jgi:hypothetical protein
MHAWMLVIPSSHSIDHSCSTGDLGRPCSSTYLQEISAVDFGMDLCYQYCTAVPLGVVECLFIEFL